MLTKYTDHRPKEFDMHESIISFAKRKDEPALADLVAKGFYLSAFKGLYNPIMQLAEQNEVDGVELLMYRFKGSYNHALEGFARGGHDSKVKELLATGANARFAIEGYAFKGDVKQVNSLLKNNENNLSLIYDAIYGYALGGHVELVDLLQQSIKPCEKLTKMIVEAYARGGHISQVNKLEKHHSSAINGFAMGGFIDYVHTYLAQEGLEDQESNLAIKGYAYNGQFDLVKKLIKNQADKSAAIQGLASAGYLDQVIELINEAPTTKTSLRINLNIAVFNFAFSNHIEQVNQLIKMQASREEALRGYDCGLLLKDSLPLLIFTEDEPLRKRVAMQAARENPSFNKDEQLANTAKLRAIMKAYQLGYRQASALCSKEAREWLLQSQQLVKQEQLPAELFEHISTFVVGLSSKDTRKLMHSVAKKLFMNKLNYNFNNTCYTFFMPKSCFSYEDSESLNNTLDDLLKKYAIEASVNFDKDKKQHTIIVNGDLNQQLQTQFGFTSHLKGHTLDEISYNYHLDDVSVARLIHAIKQNTPIFTSDKTDKSILLSQAAKIAKNSKEKNTTISSKSSIKRKELIERLRLESSEETSTTLSI